MGVYQFERVQKVNASVEEVWDFISSPKNLKEITPPSMGFDITSGSLPEKMYPGMIIRYKVKPLLGIPMTWVTEISQVETGSFFVDEQRFGPYSIWHHQHHIEPIEGGTLMTDIVTYSPPMGFIGSVANALFIRKKLISIFNFREQAIINRYGDYKTKTA